MIIGYLILGVLAATGCAALALMTGFGVLAAFGFYVLGGSLTMMGLICLALWHHPLGQHKPVTIEA